MENSEHFLFPFIEISVSFEFSVVEFINQLFLLDLSTLIHVETIQTHLILNEIQTNSVYFAMVAVCNRLDCGPSSSVIRVHSSTSGTQSYREFSSNLITCFIVCPMKASTVTFDVAHPINKPLLLKCSSDNPSWLQK